jgi:hypothetical protein
MDWWSLSGETRLYFFVIFLWPLSRWIIPHLKTRENAINFTLIYGFLTTIIVFGYRSLFAVVNTILGYVVLDLRPRDATIILFIFNCLVHLYYLVYQTSGWSMEITGPCMMIFQKVVSLCYNLADGKTAKSGAPLKHSRFNLFKLDEKPSLRNFFAYCFTPYGGHTGPFYEYRSWLFVMDAATRPPIASDSKDRSDALKYLFYSILHAIFHLTLGKLVDFHLFERDFYLACPFPIKLFLMYVVSNAAAARYFVMWHSVNAGLIELGLASSGFTSEDDFSQQTLLWVLGSLSIAEWCQRWNHTTHVFWKNYLYLRLLDGGVGGTIANAAVFVFSSSWHGFRPAYYLILFETLLGMAVDGLIRNRFVVTHESELWKQFVKAGWVSLTMLSAACGWWTGTLEWFVRIHNGNYWAMVWINAAMYGVLFCTRQGRPKQE